MEPNLFFMHRVVSPHKLDASTLDAQRLEEERLARVREERELREAEAAADVIVLSSDEESNSKS